MLLHGCCVTFGPFVEGLGGLLLLLLGAGSGQLSMFIGSTGGLSSALVRVMVVGGSGSLPARVSLPCCCVHYHMLLPLHVVVVTCHHCCPSLLYCV